MKPVSAFLLFLLTPLLWGGELPWIGVSLAPASGEEQKKASLGDGIGFRVSRMTNAGPLAKAGGQEGDIWWKFDGQILVNKEQMSVLLRSKSVGDAVPLEFFREGKLKNATVVLEARRHPRHTPINLKANKSTPEPPRVLAKRERVARIFLGQQELSLRSEGAGWRFHVMENEILVLSAWTSGKDWRERLPAKYYETFMILKQTLVSRKKSEEASGEGVGQLASKAESSGE